MARTTASARLRTGSQCCTAAASTVIEKKTLPSLTTMSDTVPVSVNGDPSGLATLASATTTSSFDTAMTISLRAAQAAAEHSLDRPAGAAVNVQAG